MMDHSAWNDPTRRTAFKGPMLYVFLIGLGGGFYYVPVTMFYWITYMIFLFGLPWGVLQERLADAGPAKSMHEGDGVPLAVAEV